MSVELKNFAAFDTAVVGWLAAVRAAAEEAAVGMARTAFNHILRVSPQSSGDFVANWKIDVNRIVPRFDGDIIGGRYLGYRVVMGRLAHADNLYKRGDMPAILHAESANIGSLAGFKLGDRVFVHNSAAHDTPYAWKIEEGLIKFRPVNNGADAVVRRGASYVANRFKTIGPTQLRVLRKIGI